METKKDLIGSELMKEVISIRLDTMWRMIALKKAGRMPGLEEEGAAGAFDNKGALFVPGNFVYGDSDRKSIEVEPLGRGGKDAFRAKIREAMRYDNATLLYPEGLAMAVNLDNGFFAEMAGHILSIKQAAGRRTPVFKPEPPGKYSSINVTRSYCPAFVNPPYGSRTKLSSCIAVCLIEPMLFFVLCRTSLKLRGDGEKSFWSGLGASLKPITASDGTILAGPHVVVCHTTRYRQEYLGGITRIMGFGRFGEFATFTLEEAGTDLLNEVEGGRSELLPADVFAEYEGRQVVGVLRNYPKTTPGKRLQRTVARLVSPARDLDLDVEKISAEARERYRVP